MPTVTISPELVRALVGDLVDADEVAKMGPDPSSVHVNDGLTPVRVRRRVRKLDDRTQRQVTAGLSATGAVAGTAGLAYAADDILTGRYLAKTKKIPYKVPGKTKALIPLELAGLGGEVMATRILHNDTMKARSQAGVAKAEIPLPRMLAGRLSSIKGTFGLGPSKAIARPRLTGAAGPQVIPKPLPQAGRHWQGTPYQGRIMTNSNPAKVAPGAPRGAVGSNAPGPLTPGQQGSMASAANHRQKVEEFFHSTAGKVSAGAGGAIGAERAVERHQRSQDQQSYYGKRHDVEIAGTFSKFDDDKKRAYGWASVVTMDGEPVVDRQGDYIGLDDIEEAAYAYVRKSRVTGDMHRRTHDDAPHKAGELIESVVFTADKCHAMGLPASFAGRWWMGVQVEDEDVWAEVKKGNRTGFSIHGKGIRKDTTLDEIRAGR